MNYHLLDDKIGEIRRLPQFRDSGVSEESLLAFGHALEQLRGWELVRINPIDFAVRHGFSPDEALAIFILAGRTGLFAFEWNLLCPLCGGREHSYGSLRELDREVYHCSLCDGDVTVEADSRLEVSFSMPQSVSGEWPDPYVSLAEYWSYFFSSSLAWAAEDEGASAREAEEAPPALDLLASGLLPPLRFAAVPAGKRARIRLEVTPSRRHRLLSLDTHSVFTVWMKDDPDRAPEQIDLVHRDTGFDRTEAFAPLAATEVHLENRSPRVIGIIIGSPDAAYLRSVIERRPPFFRPFVTGKALLNNQTFRDLLRADDLPDDLSLRINDVTLLCAGLKAPGGNAARLVERRFQAFRAIVRAQRGAIVRTAGDAILASFNEPADGLRAADLMLKAAGRPDEPEVAPETGGLRIGLHRGAVIAVKANRSLDFFGQTLNIASRLLALAGPDEIRMTDEIMRDGKAAAHLRSAGYSAVARDVALQGVGGLVRVYSCRR